LSLDVSSFEQSSMFETVREAMLNRATGSFTIEASVGVGGDRSEFRTMNVTYYYAPIDGTPFRYRVQSGGLKVSQPLCFLTLVGMYVCDDQRGYRCACIPWQHWSGGISVPAAAAELGVRLPDLQLHLQHPPAKVGSVHYPGAIFILGSRIEKN